MLRIAICDDDVSTMGLLQSSIASVFSKRNVPVRIQLFSSAQGLGQQMEKTGFDLLFLDIQMPGISGISFAQRLRQNRDKTQIIYVSSREDRVFDALQTQPFGFVRKSHFLTDIVAVIDLFLDQQPVSSGQSIAVQQKGGIVCVEAGDVRYIEGCGKTQIVCRRDEQEPILLHATMETLTEQFEPLGFLRVHKGFLVNCRYIASIQSTTIELVGGDQLPLSRRSAQQIREKYLDYLKGQGALLL